jgi:flagellar P-ring protein precursor FlgI
MAGVRSALRGIVAGLLTVALVVCAGRAGAAEERIKDLADIAGVRTNQLVGYGLVIGLDGTGDQTTQAPFTAQSLRNMLVQLGVTIPPGVNLQTRNTAAVMVTADLPPFAKPGQLIDITVSSIANATSLRGGTLLLSPLRGIDNGVYAVAQGNLVVGGLGVEGGDGSRVSINVPSVGRIPSGATVEREVPTAFGQGDNIVLNLKRSDFTTARRLADTINASFGVGLADAIDATSVRVRAPLNLSQRVSFTSEIENLLVEPGQPRARVVVNSRTGTVVIDGNVQVTAAAVSHGSLTVTITENFDVSQPSSFTTFGSGQTVITPRTDIEIDDSAARMFPFGPGTTLEEIVRAVNDVGAAPGDLVAILEALHTLGALRAELIVI